MNIIEPMCGDTITNVAAQLCASAPARAYVNGMWLRARYRTTRATDIVAQYWRVMNAPTDTDTPESRRRNAKRAAEISAKQAVIDECVREASVLDFERTTEILEWVERIERPADDVGVAFDKPAIVARFEAGGWGANVNTGEAFDNDDARNFAGWIVGQWLHCGYPVGDFIAQWRERFMINV